MLRKHTTTEGKTMLIAEMTDSHLTNLVNMKINKLFALKMQIEQPNTFNDKLNRAMYKRETISQEDALEYIPRIIDALYPYLAEMWFRRLGVTVEIQEKFESVLGRKGTLPPDTGSKLLLSSGGSPDESEEDDNDDPLENWGDK